MSRAQALWDGVLAVLLLVVALSGIFWLDSPASTVVGNVVLGLAIGTLLGVTGRGLAFALLILVLLAGPLATRFVLVDGQLVWGPWLFSLLAGWFIGTTAHALAHVTDFLSDEPSSPSGNWWTGEDVLFIKPSFP